MTRNQALAHDGEDDVLATLRRCVLHVVPEIESEEVTEDRTLAELGCNSIDRAEILTLAMSELDVTVPVSRFHQDSVLAALAATLREHHG